MQKEQKKDTVNKVLGIVGSPRKTGNTYHLVSRIETADMLVEFFRKSFSYLELEFAGKVLAPGVTKRGEVSKNKARMNECSVLGRRLADKRYNRLHNQAL